MKIVPTFSNDKKRLKSKKNPSSAAEPINKEVSFANSLQNSVEVQENEEIDSLMKDLTQQEKKFLTAQNLYELNLYKQKVQKILKLVLNGSFEAKNLKRRRRDRADHLIIKQINDKLLTLASKITARDNKAFNLMKDIEEIRGLVCDLVY